MQTPDMTAKPSAKPREKVKNKPVASKGNSTSLISPTRFDMRKTARSAYSWLFIKFLLWTLIAFHYIIVIGTLASPADDVSPLGSPADEIRSPQGLAGAIFARRRRVLTAGAVGAVGVEG